MSTNSFLLNVHDKSFNSPIIPSENSLITGLFKQLEPQLTDIEDTMLLNTSETINLPKVNLSLITNLNEKNTSMPVCQPPLKKLTWKDKSIPSESYIQTIKSLEILDQVLTSKDGDLEELLTMLSKDHSKLLWSPTKTDSVDLDSTSWNSFFLKCPTVQSWYKTQVMIPLKKNSQMISSPLLQSFLPDSTAYENIKRNLLEKSETLPQTQKQPEKFEMKSLKLRMIPVNRCEKCSSIFNFEFLCNKCKNTSINIKKYMKEQFGFFRWYENLTTQILQSYENYLSYKYNKEFIFKELNELSIIDNMVLKNSKGQFIYTKVRDLMYYVVVKKEYDELGRTILDFEFTDNKNDQFPRNPLWKDNLEIPTRLIRGAIKRCVSNMNSYIANKKHRVKDEIKRKEKEKKMTPEQLQEKQMKKNEKLRKKKDNIQNLYFEDTGYPVCLKKIFAYYSVGNKKIPLEKLLPYNKGGINFQYNRYKNRWYIYLPVKVDFNPSELLGIDNTKNDSSNDNQGKKKFGVVSLDPGVRTFMSGYSPEGFLVKLGNETSIKLDGYNYEIDRLFKMLNYFKSRNMKTRVKQIYKKIVSNYKRREGAVNDLHWKTINFLLGNFEVILLPLFQVKQMVKKSNKKINKNTKRLLYSLSFFSFQQKLLQKKTDSKVFICNERYTTKVCSSCGYVNEKVGGVEVIECPGCQRSIDRDGNGSKNILIKNWHE